MVILASMILDMQVEIKEYNKGRTLSKKINIL